jgi:hypothetical protein
LVRRLAFDALVRIDELNGREMDRRKRVNLGGETGVTAFLRFLLK